MMKGASLGPLLFLVPSSVLTQREPDLANLAPFQLLHA